MGDRKEDLPEKLTDGPGAGILLSLRHDFRGLRAWLAKERVNAVTPSLFLFDASPLFGAKPMQQRKFDV